MIVSSKKVGNRVTFSVKLDDSDTTGPIKNPAGAGRMHTLIEREFFLDVPEGVKFVKPHPDREALALIILLNSFIGERIVFDRPVSKRFAEKYHELTGKKVEPVGGSTGKISAKTSRSRPAIAYSGGVDSAAATLIAPEESILVFLDRDVQPGQLYNKSAALQSCDEWERRGKEVHKILNNIENIIDPPTFAHPLATATPTIYLADSLDIDSIGFGSLSSHVYGLIKNKFNKRNKKPYREFDDLLSTVGLPQLHPTSGVNTSIEVLLKENLLGIAQSCMYGKALGEPCGVCFKCILKGIRVGMYTKNKTLVHEKLEKLFRSPKFAENAKRVPMNGQYGYMNTSDKLKNQHDLVAALAKKTGSYYFYIDTAGYWYQPAGHLMPEKYREEMTNNIRKYVEAMSPLKRFVFEHRNLKYQKYSPLRWFWHWRFWSKYTEQYDMHHLTTSHKKVTIMQGEVFKDLVVYKKKYPLLKKNISGEVSWGSSDGDVAYYKDGEIRAKKAGDVKLFIRYGETKLSVDVSVVS